MIAPMNPASNTRKGNLSWNMNYLVMPSDSSNDIWLWYGWMDGLWVIALGVFHRRHFQASCMYVRVIGF